MAASDRDCRDIAEFLDSMWQCFDNVDKALTDERSSVPLDYLESRLEDHFQVVNAIAIAIQDNSAELKQLVEDLLMLTRELLQEIHAVKSQREKENRRSTAWIPSTEASTGGRPRFRVTKDDQRSNRNSEGNWYELENNSTYAWDK